MTSHQSFEEIQEALALDRISRFSRFYSSMSGEFKQISTNLSDLMDYLYNNVMKIFKKDGFFLVLLLLLTGMVNFSVSYYIAFFPQYVKIHHSLTSFETGIIMSSVYISIIIFNPIVPKLIEVTKIRAELCLVAGFIVSLCVALAFAYIEKFPGHLKWHAFTSETFVLRFLLGVGVALVNVSAGFISLRKFDDSNSTESSNLIQFSIAFGYISGAPAGGIIYHFFGWISTFEILAIMHSVVFVISGLLYIFTDKSTSSSDGQEDNVSTGFDQYRNLLYNPLVLFLLINNVIGIMEFAFMHPTLGLHLAEQMGATELFVGIVFLIRDVAYAVAFVLMIILQKFTGPFLILIIGKVLLDYLLFNLNSFNKILNFQDIFYLVSVTYY